MADTEQKADDGGPGEKEANKAPSPKPDTQDANDVAPPLITVSKGRAPHQPPELYWNKFYICVKESIISTLLFLRFTPMWA